MAISKKRYAILLVCMYLVFYATDAASGYIMIWLNQIGFDTLQMGILTSGTMLISLFFQPAIGRCADQGQRRNQILMMLLVVSAFSLSILHLSHAFLWIFAIYTLFQTARNSQHALCDTITLGMTQQYQLSYGPFRAVGCIGYAVMAYLAGLLAQRSTEHTFYLYACLCLFTIGIVFMLPRSHASHASHADQKFSLRVLAQNKQFLLCTIFAVLMASTKSFCVTFFSVYFTGDLQGPTDLYGVLLSLAAFTEIPIIFFIDKLNRKVGTRNLLMLSAILETARWLAYFAVTDSRLLLILNTILGANNMTIYVVMVIYVNEVMDEQNKAVGQATSVMLQRLGSLLIGNLLGGAISKSMGIRPVFLLCVIINLCAIILFVALSRNPRK